MSATSLQETWFDSHGTRCAAWHLTATDDALTTELGRPCVVMAHGFACTRDGGLLPFAERFTAAGLDVLLFDYRGFGTSQGELRQDVDHRRHREDYAAAVRHARSLDGLDAGRIVLWGTSYSGGHVVAVAAEDPRIAAVISQGAAMDGRAALLGSAKDGDPTPGSRKRSLALAVLAARDTAREKLGAQALTVPVFAAPGELALITTDGGPGALQPILGPTFRNEMCARGIPRIAFNRPVKDAHRVRCPMLLVIAEHDEVAPSSAVHEVARRAPRSETISFDSGHFAIYGGDVFETSVARQVSFLRGHLTR